MKQRDMDRTVTGLLFNTEFLYGLLQVLCFAACAAGAVLLFRSEEPLPLLIIGALVLLFAGSSGLSSGSRHIRKAWKDWRADKE